ncbi:hypothetical protein GGX14DRAFT_629987 [Mycena pura]|uniref:F-box domain-containing protein n=1 Tax=Mycena pura TaxID=153505 RepID=A0AAD6YRZ9_9AGAR|nr:hypothetical protein GGX14DRAFT_629987 [Mycena pura]
MARVTLGDFAQELLVQIFTFLDAKDLVNSCLLVCWSWKSAIDGSMELQLVIELWADGMVAGDLPNLTIVETLDALYERRRAWLGLNWFSRIELEVKPWPCTYRLTGGVFAQLCDTSFTATWLPSARNPMMWTSTVVLDVTGRENHFVMDPTQDLVLFAYMGTHNEVNMNCRSLSSLKPYPLRAGPMVMAYSMDWNEHIRAVDLAGDVLSLFFDQGRVVLLNWCKGGLSVGINSDFPPVRPASFSLLSPRAFILGYGGDMEPQPKLEIWAIKGNIHNHVATLQLPELVRDVLDPSFATYTTGFCAIPGTGRQFSKSNDERLFVVFFLSKHLFVHFRYLLQYLANRDGPVIVPWHEWGPQHTRMLKLSDDPYLRGYASVHGKRVAHCPSPENGSAIQVLDFGMSALRRNFPGEAQPDTQCVMELHTEPSTISDERFVAKSVTTSLPYREVVRSLDESEIQYDTFITIDNDHIVRVPVENNHPNRQPVVYTF